MGWRGCSGGEGGREGQVWVWEEEGGGDGRSGHRCPTEPGDERLYGYLSLSACVVVTIMVQQLTVRVWVSVGVRVSYMQVTHAFGSVRAR